MGQGLAGGRVYHIPLGNERIAGRWIGLNHQACPILAEEWNEAGDGGMKPAPLSPGLQIADDDPHVVRVRAWVVHVMARRVFYVYPGRATDGKPARFQGLAIGLVVEGFRVEGHQHIFLTPEGSRDIFDIFDKRVEDVEGISLGLGGWRPGGSRTTGHDPTKEAEGDQGQQARCWSTWPHH